MTKKIRLLILLACVVMFFLTAPYMVLYSLGYRVNFETLTITATGGIYVKADPTGGQITIDSTIKNITGYFYNSVFVQNLLPGPHTVSVTKSGYYDYQKTLPVTQNTVTKLEHITLFQKDLGFSVLKNNVAYFSMAPNNNLILTATTTKNQTTLQTINLSAGQTKSITLSIPNAQISSAVWADDSKKVVLTISNAYYLVDVSLVKPTATPLLALAGATHPSFNPQNSGELYFLKNSNLFSNLLVAPIIKNVVAYKKNNQRITYLSSDGLLYHYDTDTFVTSQISANPFPINQSVTYTLTLSGSITLLKEDTALYLFNSASQNFETLFAPVTGVKISPDGQKALYFNDSEIWYYSIASANKGTFLLAKPASPIQDAYWLNNDYIIFSTSSQVIISEIDTRGNTNTISLAQPSDTIFFNPQDKKLYVLNQQNLLSSERLLP